MPDAVADTSVLLFLYRIKALHLIEAQFDKVLIPDAVIAEIQVARQLGHVVPDMTDIPWLVRAEPTIFPSEWFSYDLGPGELAAMSVALEQPEHIVLMDDGLARRIARAAGLQVWGTLRILLEAKKAGLTPEVAPLVDRLIATGMWLSHDMRHRILVLAGEANP